MPPLDWALAMLTVHLHSVWGESVLQLAAAVWAGVVGGVVVFVLRLQWQIECRHSPLALKTVVICYINRTSQVSAHSSVFSFNPFYLFVLAATSNIGV